MRRFTLFILALVLLPAVAFGQDGADRSYTFSSIVRFAALNEGFDTLYSAFERADAIERFEADGPFTLFAPDDTAFAAMDEADLEALMDDPEALVAFLENYVVDTRLVASELVNDARANGTAQVRTLAGSMLEFTLEGADRLRVNGAATVAYADVPAANGTVFVIDGLLFGAGVAGGLLPAMGQ